MSVSKLWNKLFLEERSSIGLSFFRIAVALTTGFHVIPSFFHLDDNYFSTALKDLNSSFFTYGALELVQRSPDGLVVFFVGLFLISWLFFLFGLFSQISCIVMTLTCYYFYALNSFHIGTLSWDILLVTLFLMCMTSYHGDYFSMDALIRKDPESYKRQRPFFIQRLLQLQIASTFFFTALCKISASGNWLKSNPLLFLMNYPQEGVTKNFLIKEWMATQPEFCFWMGIFIIVMELSMPVLLFCPKTRRSAIWMGILFHFVLILTLDVPTIFFFLFPAQMLLFIHPGRIVEWIEEKRQFYLASPRTKIVYDGHCHFCCNSVEQLKVMDLFLKYDYVDYQNIEDLKTLHQTLTKQLVASQLQLIKPNGKIYGGFFAFRAMAWDMPMLYPLIPLLYFPGASWIGPLTYRFIAQNRYLLHFNRTCKDNHCLQP